MRQTEETAMRVYNHGFAGFPELAAVVGAPLRLDAHPLKDACGCASTANWIRVQLLVWACVQP